MLDIYDDQWALIKRRRPINHCSCHCDCIPTLREYQPNTSHHKPVTTMLNPCPPITQNISLKRKIYKAVLWLRKHVVVNSRESSRDKNWCNILKRSEWHAPKLCFWHNSEPDSHERATSQAAWRHENQLTETGFERKSLRRATPPDTKVWSMTSAKPEAVLNSTFEQSPVASAQLWKLSTFRPQKSAQILTQTVWDRT